MENAQKAVMIGVGLFITIIIISAVLLITNLGTDLVDSAREKLSNISKSLQNNVLQVYDGKTLTGAQVIEAVRQYENSEMSIKIRTVSGEGKTTFVTGKYNFKVVIPDPTRPIAGGIKTEADSKYVENGIYKYTLAEIQQGTEDTVGVSARQTYYSYIVKDYNTDTVIGMVFIKSGAYAVPNPVMLYSNNKLPS